MASAESQKPSCPICKQSDQVKTTQSAFSAGVARCAPPDMPTKQVHMMSYITVGMVMVGICIFFVIILIGTEANLGIVVDGIIVSITLICTVAALVLSYIAFQRVVKGDNEASLRYPAWDRAMETWRSLYYCSRDDAVFNPKSNKVLSNEQLLALRSSEDEQLAPAKPALAQ
ncbi:hypothetical protein EPA93_35865 [Ktedonosporobacter rubrisoli]|uniref:Uncharacterized protein n=1 Tax=Ktedonosporobacter rubrisoli TaxID=2509675 RepID=A0A4P6JZX8_KTERU|nr:hypothetical protein [Ktedonosporobacter rubrisoli]QBD81062.1 hypothetical protein EPA93_35865 [Ktedonosporobacter rubrisoli]